MRYALLVEYDGTDFHGSQLQVGVRTVQGELEQALGQLYDSSPRIHFASRTDSGVHATGQVGVFDEGDRHDRRILWKALNFHTPEDLAVRRIEVVDGQFDPRRQAVMREYVYRITDDEIPSPTNRRNEVGTKPITQLDEMKQAADQLTGSHDFASFAGPATPADTSTVRHIENVDIDRIEAHRLMVTVRGNAFIHQQVRRMVGALVQVGTGKLTVNEFRNLVDQPVKGTAKWPLAPQGLSLTRIEYGKSGPFASETEYN